MLRRQQRVRKEYLYRKHSEGAERVLLEKKRRVREALEEGKPIPTELRNEEHELRRLIDLDDQERAVPRGVIDDEYANAALAEPKILLTTSRNPSQPLTQFAKRDGDAGQETEPEACAPRSGEGKDFLPLEGGPWKRLRKQQEPEEPENTATVLYIGHIPHGFYEEQMQGFFQQFGTIKRLRIARNRKTGKSKHYGFIEFENPDVAKIVADEMNNYLLFEHALQVQLVPPEKVHRKLWKGVRRGFIPIDRVAIERRRHNKDRTVAEHKKMVERIVKRDEKRRKRIRAAGIDYECPALIANIQPEAKKIKFDED